MAQITTLSGDTYIAAADFLRLGADAALPLESLGSIPFDEIASFTIALRGLNEPVTATIQLANGNTTSDIVPRDTLTGPSQVDRVAIPLQDVASVTFANSATPILVPLAMVTLRQGESVAVCATCLEMSFQTLEPYAGYRTHYERSLWLQNGLWVPVAGMRQLFFTDRYDVSILLHAGGEPISGRVRANTLRGATQGGFLNIGLNDVLQVDFQARPGFEAASSRVIELTTTDNQIYQVPLPYLRHVRTHVGLLLQSGEIIHFAEIETLTVSIQEGVYVVDALLFDGRRASGPIDQRSELAGPTATGWLTLPVEDIVALAGVASDELPAVPLSLIRVAEGAAVEVASASLTFSYRSLQGVRGLVTDYENEVRLDNGEILPLAAIQNLVVDEEGVVTITLNNGRSPLSGKLIGHQLIATHAAGSAIIDLEKVTGITPLDNP